jgi:hypothetical protein
MTARLVADAPVLSACRIETSPRRLRTGLERLEVALEATTDRRSRRSVRVAFGGLMAWWVEHGMAREPLVVEVVRLPATVRLQVSAAASDPGAEFWQALCESQDPHTDGAVVPAIGPGLGAWIELPASATSA